SGNFSASTITKVISSFSVDSFLNFGFIILQFPHHEAENCTATFLLEFTTSCKVSFSNSNNIFTFFSLREKLNTQLYSLCLRSLLLFLLPSLQDKLLLWSERDYKHQLVLNILLRFFRAAYRLLIRGKFFRFHPQDK